jgi:HlyD family secretion protein
MPSGSGFRREKDVAGPPEKLKKAASSVAVVTPMKAVDPKPAVLQNPKQPLVLRARIERVGALLWLWKWQCAAVLGAAILALYVGPGLWFGPRVAGDVAVRADFVQTVVASGHVEAPFRVNVGSQVTGVVTSVPVVEGQSVKAGETLIILDDREARATMVQAEGVVAQGEARMRQLREFTLPSAEQTLAQAQATLVNAQKSYDRTEKLAADGYATTVALENAVKSLDLARSQVTSAQLQVATSQIGGSDYVLADTQLSQAKASVAAASSRLSHTVITAPRDGVLISRHVEVGSIVQPSVVLMALSPTGETQLVVQIDERNLGLIAVGQSALASADAYAARSFPAEVVYINPSIDIQRASVEVKLRVLTPPAYVRQDMTVSVDIEIARRPNSVIVPSGSIRRLADGKAWLMTVNGGRTRQQFVEVGLVSGGKAEIISGLEEKQIAIPSTNTAIKLGQRVRATAAVGRPP